MWYQEWQSLVEYGPARFIKDDQVAVEEPLALVSIMRYFESQDCTFGGNIRQRLQENKGLVAIGRNPLLRLLALPKPN